MGTGGLMTGYPEGTMSIIALKESKENQVGIELLFEKSEAYPWAKLNLLILLSQDDMLKATN